MHYVTLYFDRVDFARMRHGREFVADPAGSQLCAYVELSTEGRAVAGVRAKPGTGDSMATEVQGWCRERLPAAAVPAVVVFLPGKLPRSSAGKLQRGALPAPDQAMACNGLLQRTTKEPEVCASDHRMPLRACMHAFRRPMLCRRSSPRSCHNALLSLMTDSCS